MLQINGQKSQITAVARHPDLGVLVGEEATYEEGVTTLDICFKTSPDDAAGWAATRPLIVAFAGRCHAPGDGRRAGDGRVGLPVRRRVPVRVVGEGR